MNDSHLKECFKRSLQLNRASENKKLLQDLMRKLKVTTITELASNKYLDCSRAYIYKLLKGISPISKGFEKKIIKCNQKVVDTIK